MGELAGRPPVTVALAEPLTQHHLRRRSPGVAVAVRHLDWLPTGGLGSRRCVAGLAGVTRRGVVGGVVAQLVCPVAKLAVVTLQT